MSRTLSVLLSDPHIDGGAAAPHAPRERAAELPHSLLDGEPVWPSECERLAFINTVPGSTRSAGEQYLEEAFFLTPRRRAVLAETYR